ncbi:FIVAR domain-containing protein [Paenibacillus sedimenti]|uniref:FIVAR domain-containing protein n=1 Tax=Paenibacillus sedimenti TaxID=2770274 RepID=A0A926KM74_9BACL|nr:FIVAR domain-containing protein [Paenibacillus sedimenti]MBD0378590.1 FIVAR domain-containing protein [Paenibacillus sedimenti]
MAHWAKRFAFQALLDQPFITGAVAGEYSLAGVDWDGGQLSRREAWERVLKANFDFARSRLSYIYNQVMYTYEGAWEAHEGLRIIGSRFFEGKERSHQILLESLGTRPFLGEEVLVGPNGEELDLYHSLFYHDQTARFTNDYLQIVAKGLAKSKLDSNGEVVRRLPYGKHYTGITEAGQTRENGYVANYGESTNYLPEYFFKTLFNGGDEQLNNEILKLALKNLHARGFTRYASADDDGKRIMRMEQVIDERNATYPGNSGYGIRVNEGKALLYASLEMYMAQNEQKYSDPEWDLYWEYAKEAVGFAQQQLADHQYFNYFSSTTAKKNKTDYLLADTYKYITETRAGYDRFDSLRAGVVLPQTDFDYYTQEEISELGVNPSSYEQFAWTDIDNMFISMRDGDLRIFAHLNERNKGYSGNGRLHVLNDRYDNIVQIATNGKFQYQDYYTRMGNIDIDFFDDQLTNGGIAPQSLAGEIIPVTYQPGVGKTDRDNFESDTPYAGYPDLLTARYGKYLMVFNTTRDEYGNKQSFDVKIPADYKGTTVLDLVSGKQIPVAKNGKVTIPPKSSMVLKLTSDFHKDPEPFTVNFVHALAGNGYAGITWKTTAGAESYTVKRSESENGKYEVIATGIKGNYYKDSTAQNGKAYYYKVAAVNQIGAGDDSYRAKLDLTAPVSWLGETIWRDDRIGDISAGRATVNGASIAIQSVNGKGLGDGDDHNIYKRDIHDSLHYVNQVTAGNSFISTKIDLYDGAASGIMMRDKLDSNARYIYFGADQDGNLVLQNRTKDSRHTFTDLKMSPFNAGLIGFHADDFPYIKLVRDYDSHFIHAYVSRDGTDWIMVKKLFTPFPYAVYAGITTAKNAQFSDVTVEETARGIIYPYLQRVNNGVSLSWNKPKQAVSFSLYRTYDKETSLTDLVFKEGTTELVEGSPWTTLVSNSMVMSFTDKETGFEDSPGYKIAAIYLDGTVRISDTVYPPAETAPPLVSDIKITNNPAGFADTIEVSGLSAGSVVKVYSTPLSTAVLGTTVTGSTYATVTGSTYATISIPQIGVTSGKLYVSVTAPGKLESARTAKIYTGEDGLITIKVEKDATLRFNTTAPGGSTEFTILSNGADYEANKRYGIVTFNTVPDFNDADIESVTLRMYRYNGRTATMRAHHIDWDDWVEPGASGTLGAQLKSEYFGGNSQAIAAFFAGQSASAGIKPENAYTMHNINASWNLNVTEILKAEKGNRATFLLSVPSAEGNPATKEYVSGTSSPGQYGPSLIVQYKVNKNVLIGLIAAIETLNPSDYTSESWSALQAGLTSAREVAANTAVSQTDVNKAATNLNTAMDALMNTTNTGMEASS